MKNVVVKLALSLALILPGAVLCQDAAPKPQTTSQTSHDDRLIESGSYVNKQGNVVHRPAHTVSGQAPTGATAQCQDGSYSFSQSHRGTCSHHGGVAKWL